MKKKICTFGDSIMRGVVSDEKGADGKPIYKVSDMGFVNRCEQKLGVRILNFSCFGKAFCWIVKKICLNSHDLSIL